MMTPCFGADARRLPCRLLARGCWTWWASRPATASTLASERHSLAAARAALLLQDTSCSPIAR
jgi:hypothetical protein